MTEVTATKIHETRWTGTLTGEEQRALLLEALRDKLGAPFNGTRLETKVLLLSDSDELPTIAFAFVHDHDWWSKASPNDEG